MAERKEILIKYLNNNYLDMLALINDKKVCRFNSNEPADFFPLIHLLFNFPDTGASTRT